MAVIGKTGMGKSTLLETLMLSDARLGEGFALLDPHGDLADRVWAQLPESRRQDVVYFNPSVPEGRLGLNIRENPGVDPTLVVEGVISVFKKIWAPDFWGPRMEHIFRNALWSLVHAPGATLADVRKILVDRTYRRSILQHVPDGAVQEFWSKEFERYPPQFREEAIAPILNKLGQFLTHPVMREVLTQPSSAFSLRQMMDEGKILIANLARGRLGEDASRLLGSLLTTHCQLAALSRADIAEDTRRDFYLYLDEFPTMATSSVANLLAEARKYRLNMILAMQYVEQLEPSLRSGVFENVGTLIAFRVGPESAETLGGEFAPVFGTEDLLNLPRYHVYLRLMIEGVPSQPFSARTLPPTVS
jgi:hypothetical protein